MRERGSAIVGKRWIEHEVDVDRAAAVISDLVPVDAADKAAAGGGVADEIIERVGRLGRSNVDEADDVAGSRSVGAGEISGDDGVMNRHCGIATNRGGCIQTACRSLNNPIAG